MTPDSGTGASSARVAHPLMRIALAWLPAVAYMALIWWLSSKPIVLPLPELPWRDKLAHVVEYGILGFLLSRAVRGSWPSFRPARALVAAALLTSIWGYVDEIHQAFVPGRNSSAWDLLADVVGAVLGVTAYGLLATLWRAAAAARRS